MNRKPKPLYITFIVLFVLLLSVSGAIAQDPIPQGRTEPQSSVSIAAPLNSRISYQGMLAENGAPVDGSRDMTFRLYSDDACITLLESHIKSDVTVSDGLFSVELDVGHGYFDGQGLWLEVEVEGTSIGCREILSVPYALSLRPGANVVGERVGWDALHIHNTATTGLSYGLYGQTDSSSNDAKGVVGYANASSGQTSGVYGQTASSSNEATGVFGYASAGSGETSGVYGQTNSSSNDAKGVHGYAPASSGQVYGVYGETDSSTNYTAGVYGTASASSGTTYGVSGASYSTSGRGVTGVAYASSGVTYGVWGLSHSNSGSASGVWGETTASSGSTIGVRGQNASSEGAGVSGYSSAASGSRLGVVGTVWMDGYGLYTTDDLYVGGSCTGCTMVFIALNASQETLQVGDVVAVGGVGPSLRGHSTPVLEVHRATAGDVAVLGVVQGRGEFYAARGDQPLDDSDIVQSAAGDVASGDYLLVVTSGLAQVRVAPSLSGLAPGQTLTIGDGTNLTTLSAAGARPGLAFARAMEAQPDENGLIWALIGAQ
jgi:hypothetical protein